MKRLLFVFFVMISVIANSQKVNPSLLTRSWSAFWITGQAAPPDGYGIYYFRKKISLSEKPDSFIVNVSADNRYMLFVNEKFVSLGPARNDLYHWNFQTVDLA